MWLLKGIKDDNRDQVHYIYQSKDYVVSRKEGDVVLSNDMSISRQHARIIHETEIADQIVIMDLGSKYGTFTIEESGEKNQLTANEPIPFKSGSVIQFGLQWNAFRVENVPLIVCPSTLSSAEKSELKEIIQKLKGVMVNDWKENTTHLTMNKITLTPKVLCALGHGQPIVNLNYWQAFCQAVENNRLLPSYEDFIPPSIEKALNNSKTSFKIDKRRRKLFSGKTMVTCCPAQKQRIGNIIIAAGGQVIDMTESQLTKEQLCDPSFIVMKPSPKDTNVTGSYQQVIGHLKDKDLRPIGESELGLSIVYCSIDKYCNPLLDSTSNSLRTDGSLLPQSNASVIVPEWQESSKETKNFDKSVIPESAPLLTPANKSRNKLIDSDEEEPMNHKKAEQSPIAEKLPMNDTTIRTEAPGDLSRDVFASLENPKPSTSRRSSSSSLFSSASATSRKRPSAFPNDDDEENVFDFGEDRLSRRQSERSVRLNSTSRSEQNENKAPVLGSFIKPSDLRTGLSKRPRLCMDDQDDVFNFPSERRSSTTVKRRISLLDDEVDSANATSDSLRSKRTRLEEPGTSKESLNPNIKQSISFSWSQEIKKLDEQLTNVGFIPRQKPIKVEKQEDEGDNEEDVYLQYFRDKAVIETKHLIPEKITKPVEAPQANDGPNFKKFKKNKIFRANVTKIMGKDCLKPFKMSENQDVWGNLIQDEEEVDAFPDFEQGSRRVGRGR